MRCEEDKKWGCMWYEACEVTLSILASIYYIRCSNSSLRIHSLTYPSLKSLRSIFFAVSSPLALSLLLLLIIFSSLFFFFFFFSFFFFVPSLLLSYLLSFIVFVSVSYSLYLLPSMYLTILYILFALYFLALSQSPHLICSIFFALSSPLTLLCLLGSHESSRWSIESRITEQPHINPAGHVSKRSHHSTPVPLRVRNCNGCDCIQW